ncbi:hypothetical protein BGX38DRAFT_1263267 [Terfezia claveryi]|nr:hypothetical protein BGX38DRAFT_1263267 [Terfezia claveryi]
MSSQSDTQASSGGAGPAPSPKRSQSVSTDATPVPERRTTQKWQPWEDRALAKQVLADDPYNCTRGQAMKGWELVAENLACIQPVPIKRSAIACKSRCIYLVKAHKAKESLSLQKTGADELVSEYTRDMDEIVMRSDQHGRDPEVKAEAKRRLEELEQDGKRVREEAMRGQAVDLGSRSSEKNQDKKRRKRNQMEQLVELSQKLEKEEKAEKDQIDSLIAEESAFRGQLLVQHEWTINSLENLAESIHQESQR